MPEITINLSDKTVTRLMAEVNQTKREHHQELTLEEWITLHLKEVVIAEELVKLGELRRQQAEKDVQVTFQENLNVDREMLLMDLD